MGSIELIGFIFLVALATFVSILRRRLRGTDQGWTTPRQGEHSDDFDASVGTPQQAADLPHRSAHLHGGYVSNILRQKLTEVIDSLHPAPQPVGAESATATSYPETRPTKTVGRSPPTPIPAVNEVATQETIGRRESPAAGARSIRHGLREGNSMRRAVIMKELLDKPVSMRGPGMARRSRGR